MKKKTKDDIYHDRADGYQSIVHAPRFFNIARLESQLKAAASHAKAHSVQIDMIIKCCTVFCF